MNRKDLEKYILETYGCSPDYPWMDYPEYAVFRHSKNRKWFALIMKVPKNRLNLNSDELADIVNLKCDPIIIGSLRTEKGFFPAYHMNKTTWITVLLDESLSVDKIKLLLDISFELTAKK